MKKTSLPVVVVALHMVYLTLQWWKKVILLGFKTIPELLVVLLWWMMTILKTYYSLGKNTKSV